MKRSEIIFGALRLPVDYLAIMAAFLLAYYLRPITDLIPGSDVKPDSSGCKNGVASHYRFPLFQYNLASDGVYHLTKSPW